MRPAIAGGGVVASCADPTVLRGRGEDRRRWYMYCTTDPLNDGETAPAGAPEFHPIPMLVSTDLVNWRYAGDALPSLPSWADPAARLWAPDIVYSRATDRYYLTFTVTETGDEESVTRDVQATAPSAWPPAPVRPGRGRSRTPLSSAPDRQARDCSFYWTFDPGRARRQHRLQQRPVLRQLLRRRLRPAGDGHRGRDDDHRLGQADHRGCQGRAGVRPGAAANQTEVPAGRRGRGVHRRHDPEPLRGLERRTSRRLVLLLRLGDKLLQRTTHWLQRLRGSVTQPARAFRRPRGELAAGRPGRRNPGDQHEREPLGRDRAQLRLPRPGRPVVDRLPRSRQERPVLQGRARVHQAAGAARPSHLGRRLAVGPGRPVGIERADARSRRAA